MGDFPTGVYRSATFGTTISNFKGGAGAVRIFSVHIGPSSVTPTGLTFYNGLSASADAYLTVATDKGLPSTANYESSDGILFPNGCFIATHKAISYGTVMFRNEVL